MAGLQSNMLRSIEHSFLSHIVVPKRFLDLMSSPGYLPTQQTLVALIVNTSMEQIINFPRRKNLKVSGQCLSLLPLQLWVSKV